MPLNIECVFDIVKRVLPLLSRFRAPPSAPGGTYASTASRR